MAILNFAARRSPSSRVAAACALIAATATALGAAACVLPDYRDATARDDAGAEASVDVPESGPTPDEVDAPPDAPQATDARDARPDGDASVEAAAFDASCPLGAAGERLDPPSSGQLPTEREVMHVCPAGSFVIGIRADRNLLLCTAHAEADSFAEFAQGGDGGIWNHCPTGTAITGIHHGTNGLRCAPHARLTGASFFDGHTQRCDMLACPLGSVAVGYASFATTFECQRVAQ